jgi:hypothetical protein
VRGFGSAVRRVPTSEPSISGRKTVSHIVVDDEQAKIISEATDSVEIRDRHGNRLGFVTHEFTDEDIAIARQRLASDEPRRTTQEVLDHLRSLEKR